MTLELKKDEVLELSKEVALDNLIFAGGWSPSTTGKTADVDLAVVFFGENGKPLVEDGVCDTIEEVKKTAVYFGKLKSDCGSVVHHGDNRTGAGEGDDEKISINLTTLPAHIHGFKLIAFIYQAKSKGQNFTLIKDEYVRIFDAANNKEIKFATDFGAEETFEAVEVTRSSEGWALKAVGKAVDGELVKYINSLLA